MKDARDYKTTTLEKFTSFIQEDNYNKAINLIVGDYDYSIFSKKDRKKFHDYISMNLDEKQLENSLNNHLHNRMDPTANDLAFLKMSSAENPSFYDKKELLKIWNDGTFRFGYDIYEDKYGMSFLVFLHDLATINNSPSQNPSLSNKFLQEIMAMTDIPSLSVPEDKVMQLLTKTKLSLCKKILSDSDSEKLLDFFCKDYSPDAIYLVNTFDQYPNVLMRLSNHAINLQYIHSKSLFRALAQSSFYEPMKNMIDKGFSQVTEALDIFAEQGLSYQPGGIPMVMKGVTRKFSPQRRQKMLNIICDLDAQIEYVNANAQKMDVDPNLKASQINTIEKVKVLRDELKEALEIDLQKATSKKVASKS